MASFADTFARSFNSSFQQTIPIGMQLGSKAYAAELQKQADLNLANAINAGDQDQQDHIQGVGDMATIRAVGNLPPGARKAATNFQMERLKKQGINVSPVFAEWFAKAKPDELNAVLDTIYGEARKDPDFGRKKVVQTISDSDTFMQILTQVAPQANQSMETGVAPKATPASVQAQAQINRLTRQRDAMQAALLKAGPHASKNAIAYVNSRISVLNDQIKKQEAIVESERVDLRELSQEKEKLAEKGTLRKFVDENGKEMNVFEMGNRTFTDTSGNPVDVSKGMVTTLGSKEEASYFGPDGMITAKGKNAIDKITTVAGEKARAREEGQNIEKNRQQVRDKQQQLAEISNLALGVYDILDTPAGTLASGFGGKLVGFVNGIVTQIEALGGLFQFENGDAINVERELADFRNKYTWVSGLTAQAQSSLIRLAYVMAKANDPAGRVAKDDFNFALQQLGASSGNPETLKDVISSTVKQFVFSSDSFAKTHLPKDAQTPQLIDARSVVESIIDKERLAKLLDRDTLSNRQSPVKKELPPGVTAEQMIKKANELIKAGKDPDAVDKILSEHGLSR